MFQLAILEHSLLHRGIEHRKKPLAGTLSIAREKKHDEQKPKPADLCLLLDTQYLLRRKQTSFDAIFIPSINPQMRKGVYTPKSAPIRAKISPARQPLTALVINHPLVSISTPQ